MQNKLDAQNPTEISPPPQIERTILGHSWGELYYEVFVVVLGVALALIGQQIVDNINWGFKVNSAEAAIRDELSNDLALAKEHQTLNRCMNSYLDTLQRAVIAGDSATIRRLNELKPPLPGRAWPRDTWTAALSNQVSDHMDEGKVAIYSRAFLRISVQREFMQAMEEAFPVALSGGFGLPSDAGVIHDQIVAIQQLRSLEARRLMIGTSLLTEDGPEVAIVPLDRYFAEDNQLVAACQTSLAEITAKAG